VAGVLGRIGRAVRAYPGRNPVTVGYLAVLAASWVLLRWVLGPVGRGRVLAAVSTDLVNLPRRPVSAVLGSLLVVDTSAGPLFVALIVGGGIAVCLAALERRVGALWAVTVGVSGHLVATAVSVAVVLLAVRHGLYPAWVRAAPDYGVSYLAMTAATAVSVLIRPRPLAVGYAAVVLALPFTAMTWYGWLPDFTTIGHLIAGLAGLAAAVLLVRRRQARVGTGPSGDAGVR
jgi:hypothetical protein